MSSVMRNVAKIDATKKVFEKLLSIFVFVVGFMNGNKTFDPITISHDIIEKSKMDSYLSDRKKLIDELFVLLEKYTNSVTRINLILNSHIDACDALPPVTTMAVAEIIPVPSGTLFSSGRFNTKLMNSINVITNIKYAHQRRSVVFSKFRKTQTESNRIVLWYGRGTDMITSISKLLNTIFLYGSYFFGMAETAKTHDDLLQLNQMLHICLNMSDLAMKMLLCFITCQNFYDICCVIRNSVTTENRTKYNKYINDILGSIIKTDIDEETSRLTIEALNSFYAESSLDRRTEIKRLINTDSDKYKKILEISSQIVSMIDDIHESKT